MIDSIEEYLKRFGEETEESIKRTKFTGRETGFGVCKSFSPIVAYDKSKMYNKTETVVGREQEVKIPTCKTGEHIGVFHTHPMDMDKPFELSFSDKWSSIVTGQEFECVGQRGIGKGELKCYFYDKDHEKYEGLQDRAIKLMERGSREFELKDMKEDEGLTEKEEKEYRGLKVENKKEFEVLKEQIMRLEEDGLVKVDTKTLGVREY